ncbi:MAG TPA: ZIP family metal transporter, partial [Candidatus Thermoplasmatota archaeon]|nr:ZIP family metal transporter [Candidatus Thermoplasmatota archaeon]
LHNFLDGIVVAAGFLVDVPTGIATTIAVAMHEIPQEFGDFGVLLRAGFRPLQAAAFNLGSALFAMGGAVLLLALPFEAQTIQKLALPVVAGGFLYIAAADLIPELHHHTRARYVPGVVGLLVVGLALMASLTLLE